MMLLTLIKNRKYKNRPGISIKSLAKKRIYIQAHSTPIMGRMKHVTLSICVGHSHLAIPLQQTHNEHR